MNATERRVPSWVALGRRERLLVGGEWVAVPVEGLEGATHVSVAQATAKLRAVAATSASLRERLAKVDAELQATRERAEVAEADALEWKQAAEQWHADAGAHVAALEAHVAALVGEKRNERKKRQAAQAKLRGQEPKRGPKRGAGAAT